MESRIADLASEDLAVRQEENPDARVALFYALGNVAAATKSGPGMDSTMNPAAKHLEAHLQIEQDPGVHRSIGEVLFLLTGQQPKIDGPAPPVESIAPKKERVPWYRRLFR